MRPMTLIIIVHFISHAMSSGSCAIAGECLLQHGADTELVDLMLPCCTMQAVLVIQSS